MEVRQDWFFTFGCGQPNAGHYIIINGTFESARDEMIKRYGTCWCMQYASKEEAGVEKWHYIEIK